MREFLTTVFDLWSFGFWLLGIAEMIGLGICLHKGRGGFGLGALLAGLIALDLMGNVPVFSWLWMNIWYTPAFAAIYIAGGIVWAFIAWHFFTSNHAMRYEALRQTKEKEGIGGRFKNFDEWFQAQSYNSQKDGFGRVYYRPSATEHKDRIISYITLFPASMLETFIRQFVFKFGTHLYLMLREHFQAISDRNWNRHVKSSPTTEGVDTANATC